MSTKNLAAKLKSQKGESMIELLVACIIAVLAVSMVADVMVSASRALSRMETAHNSNAELLDDYWTGGTSPTTDSITISADAFSFSGTLNSYSITSGDNNVTIYDIT